MFREITISKKEDGGYVRRWYQDDRMDLFVWFEGKGEIVRFQLTYDKPNAEKAIDWKREGGFMHSRIDDGTNPGGHPGTPLLIHGGVFAKDRVIAGFRKNSTEIDPRIAKFVLDTLRAYYDETLIRRLKKKMILVGAVSGGLLLAWRLWR